MFQSHPGLWRWPELCQALALNPVPGPDVQRVITDSRQVQAGDLFIALSGDPGARFNPSYRSSVDGHDFVDQALNAGACGAMVQHPIANAPAAPQLRVADTYDGLWALGRFAAQRLTGPKIAITGSSGKTTTKTFLQAATGGYASPGSYNNHIGVPLSLANAPAGQVAYAFEVGTNHPGEIEPLARLVQPDVAVVLNVHTAHMENFPSRAELIKEKVSIFNSLNDKSNSIWEETLALSQGYAFGTQQQSAGRLEQLNGDLARYRILDRVISARVPGGGTHRALTLAAVLLTLALLELDLQAAADLPAEVIPAGRGRLSTAGGVTLVDDSYNANPQSMLAAIQTFADRPEQHKLAIIGEMLELGEAAGDAHASLAPELQQLDVICVGEGARDLAAQLDAPWYATADAALITAVVARCAPGDSVLVKGSNRVFWQMEFVPKLLEVLNKN